jgi:hypothetical protein
LIDERFWWSKTISVERRDPKRIQRRKRTTQNAQKQLRMLRMDLANNKREKLQISQNSVKMA